MNTNPNKEQHFIAFRSKTVGKTIKARINVSQIIKYLKRNDQGEYIFDFYIARRKKPTKNGVEYIAWTEFETVDNTELVEKIFSDKEEKDISI